MTDKSQSGGSDDGSQAPPENAEKPSSLTDLLDEWDKKDAKPPESGASDDIGDRLSALERRAASESYSKEMESVVGELKGDLNIDDFVVEAWINKQADDDTRLRDLYTNRDENPRKWQTAVKALKPEFEEFAKTRVMPKSSDDKGVSAAVRAAKDSPGDTGLSTDDVDYGSLSDSDFALQKAEVFRLAKAGKLT